MRTNRSGGLPYALKHPATAKLMMRMRIEAHELEGCRSYALPTSLPSTVPSPPGGKSPLFSLRPMDVGAINDVGVLLCTL